jgi:hypothetical protein
VRQTVQTRVDPVVGRPVSPYTQPAPCVKLALASADVPGGINNLCRAAVVRNGLALIVVDSHSDQEIASLTPVQHVARCLQRTYDVHQVDVDSGEGRGQAGEPVDDRMRPCGTCVTCVCVGFWGSWATRAQTLSGVAVRWQGGRKAAGMLNRAAPSMMRLMRALEVPACTENGVVCGCAEPHRATGATAG